MSYFTTKEYFTRVALGEIEGASIINKFGRNSDVDGEEDIIASGGDYAGFPAAFTAETLQCFSSSPLDTNAGTAAKTVKAQALTEAGVYVEVTFTLNGTTPVAPDAPYTSTLFTRCHTAYVDTIGFNVGDITIRHATTTANIFLVLPAGRNQSNHAVYTVPANTRALILNSNYSIFNGANQLASTEIALAIRNQNKAWRYRRPQEVNNFAGSSYTDIKGGTFLSAFTDVKMRCLLVSHNTTIICAAFDVYIEAIPNPPA